MKKSLMGICVVLAVLLSGCGKKSDGHGGKKVDTKKVATNIPIYQFEDEKFIDDERVDDFVFLDEEDEATRTQTANDDVNALLTAEKEEDWDEEEALAWSEEEEAVDFRTIHFDLNKNGIRSDQKELLAQDIETAKVAVDKGKKLVISGHCCPLGSASFNMSLSEKRAKSIKDEFVKAGVSESDVQILGVGSEMPVVLSDSDDREAKIRELAPNRRAEITIV